MAAKKKHKVCTRCKFNGRRDEEARAACIECLGPPEVGRSSEGQTIIRTGCMECEAEFLEEGARILREAEKNRISFGGYEQTVADLIREFKSLDTVDAVIFHSLLNGAFLPWIAAALGMSVQGVNGRIHKCLKQYDIFRKLYYMVRRAKGDNMWRRKFGAFAELPDRTLVFNKLLVRKGAVVMPIDTEAPSKMAAKHNCTR